ncbi:MAG: TIGR02281 family clan AA aspartic protease [Candidatus Omnitrophica bacterium]|nr:TIGR02281 family clan AA aspartic protease [Candidatus Omnitrophota bacterium]
MTLKGLVAGAVFCISLLLILFPATSSSADESDIIKADRQALAEARASGSSSKILAAKEQLSDDLNMEEQQRRRDIEGVSIPLVADDHGHLAADVVINYRTHASLVVDTGSPVILLGSAFAQKLGLDLTHSQIGYVEVLNGKYKAAAVSLNSVQLGQMQARDVHAVVLLQDNKEIKDGLLGMSFLSKFHFTLDQAGQKLVLRK